MIDNGKRLVKCLGEGMERGGMGLSLSLSLCVCVVVCVRERLIDNDRGLSNALAKVWRERGSVWVMYGIVAVGSRGEEREREKVRRKVKVYTFAGD